MIKHNFILSLRSFRRYKSSFLINLIGLSTGLACALLIYLWVNDELRMDQFHAKNDRLYQVMQNAIRPKGIRTSYQSPALLANALKQDFPEVEQAITTGNDEFNGRGILKQGDRQVEVDGLYATQGFFQVFSFPLAQGSPQQALRNRRSIILSKKLARQLFGTTKNIIGKTVKGNRDLFNATYQVTGILGEVPTNSTLKFDFVANYALVFSKVEWIREWSGDGAQTYVTLKKGTDAEAFNQKLSKYIQTKPDREDNQLFIQPFSERYLYGKYKNGKASGGRIAYVRLFSIIALFVLLIASINFMNLATAHATKNTKEVGVKKALGVTRGALAFRFFQESILLAFLSLLVALHLVGFLLPQFNLITGKALRIKQLLDIALPILGITLFTGLASGIYPAIYLSSFNPIKVLKGTSYKLSASSKVYLVRKGLVIFQFALSVIFIVGVVVVHQQISFVQTADVGYNRDQVIHFNMRGRYNRETLIQQLKSIPGVVNATNIHGGSVVTMSGAGSGFQWSDQKSNKEVTFRRPHIGYNFIETLGIKVIKGRTFSKSFGDESSKLMVNEAAAKLIGAQGIVGKTILDGDKKKQIIGVVKNFKVRSMHEAMQPCIMRFSPRGSDIMVKLHPSNQAQTIARIKQVYESFKLEYPFDFRFIDQEYQALYVAEQRVASLSTYFTIIAVIISCLGLLGLTIFTNEQRMKEIGIRKVLGASVLQIVRLLTSSFTKTVLSAILIALPISYLLMDQWLGNFAYRIDLQWWYFVGAGLAVLIIAWITVSLQTVRVARVNPVKCLKDE
ncbi:hypothetical protein BKI52_14095 [marine bacterium AO1-C]|nr:hypothetical protein BKI52_14095 [marine bacterium AO1-C]